MMQGPPQKWSTVRFIVGAVVIAVFVGYFTVYAEYDAVRPAGSWTLLSLSVFSILLPLAAVAVAPVAAVLVVFRPWRRNAITLLFACIAVVAIWIPLFRLGHRIRTNAFVALAQRSTSLVDTINAYTAKYGQPPASLEALVPEFLAEVPGTGMGAYPRYQYASLTGDRYHGNPWVLKVFTPTGIPDFDEFIYYPLQNYPAHIDGNPLERIGDWAYVHE